MKKLSIHPVNTLYSGYLTEMLGVVCNHRQPMIAGGNSNENIKVTNLQALASERMANFCIVAHPVFDYWKDCKRFLNLFRLFEMFLNGITVKCSVCKFGNAYLRGINLLCRCFVNMFIYPTSMVEVTSVS